MFCEYLLNCAADKHQELCVLDLDIGRNRLWPGSVSLESISKTGHRDTFSIWVGEFTPVNSIPVYLRAIEQLLAMHRNSCFTANLVVNTMGYLTGVGELILYEIYSVIRPRNVLVLESAAGQDWTVGSVRACIEYGTYANRLLFSNPANTASKTSTKITKYKNEFAMQKSSSRRF